MLYSIVFSYFLSMHCRWRDIAAVGMRHAALVDGEDGLDLPQRVGGEPFVGLVAVSFNDPALFLDVDEGIAVHLVQVLVPFQLVGEQKIIKLK